MLLKRLIVQSFLLVRSSVFAFHQVYNSRNIFTKFSFFPSSSSTSSDSTTRRINSTTTRNSMSASNTSTEEQTKAEKETELIFGNFKINKSQIFYESPSHLTAAIVNLRPIVPGHVLVIPKRIVPKLSQLTNEEYDDLWRSVRTIQNALESCYQAGGFNVAVQDGKVAGQSVPHVHVHILPRQEGDFERSDDIYDKLEEWAPTRAMREDKERNKVELEVPDDDDRMDRTMQMMEEESNLYKALMGTEANI
jgi:bis(5'-adenosyl)-triphosphatase